MISLYDSVDDYLSLRETLGYRSSQTRNCLHQFVEFAHQRGESTITTSMALAWATQSAKVSAATWGKRLGTLRGFALYCSAIDPANEVPPRGLLPQRSRRANPYPFSDNDIQNLIAAASALPPIGGLRSETYRCLFGLLAVTGLRIGEALALTGGDIDWHNNVLTISKAKFNASRFVPLHPSTMNVMLEYNRRKKPRAIASDPFFSWDLARCLTYKAVRDTFRSLCRELDLSKRDQYDSPRLHHLRHRFAIKTLTNWYADGVEVDRHLPALSTYLGHSRIAHTYWYLSLQPQLMQHATERLECRWGQES